VLRDDEAIYLDAYGADVRELVEKALPGRIELERSSPSCVLSPPTGWCSSSSSARSFPTRR
jgi:hypothetical protein